MAIDETDRVTEELAARLWVGKIEVTRVALANERCLREASLAQDVPHPPRHDRPEETESGGEGRSGLPAEPD
ncbi:MULTISPECIES: hypothetical protein [Methylorubrum]|uniref:hypothetical protein n=1 Tax=Methylorubrum TaxID=2282523 RepID=UPI0020A0DBB9|nr:MULTISPECIES: hypothetical protein [Methylorubrum]MCP1550943.1 hypothetical protein [Methylorubrum zatmanii]MCP1552444.1 hypothetical protein [Methylorubrum extorquens]MCP1581246.1 hypothetical protein [Methylorubrum extorquens]